MTEQVTLRPGDYVSTKGMTEEQYHAVARAFMAAGCGQGEYPSVSEMRQYMHFGWLARGRNVLFHGEANGMKLKRQLTPAQVIGAVNAGNQQEDKKDMLTTLLQAAETARASAEQNKILADQYSTEHERLIQQAREMLPDGWRLVRDGIPADVYRFFEDQTRCMMREADMDDPANWREGDVVICADGDHADGVSEGKCYVVSGHDEDGWPEIIDDDGDKVGMKPRRFRFHYRPNT